MSDRLARYCEGVIEAAWLLAIGITPLFFNVYSVRVFEPDKALMLRSLALLALAAWLGKALCRLSARPRPEEAAAARIAFLRRPLVAPVIALGSVYLISTCLSVAPLTSLLGSYQRLQGTFTTLAYMALFAAAAAHLRRRAQVERLLIVAMLTSLPVSVYGILQRLHLDPLPWGADTSAQVTSSLGNATFTGAYLILVIPIILGRMLSLLPLPKTDKPADSLTSRWLRLIGYLGLLGLDLTALGFTGSLTAWLSLAVGLLFFGGLLAFIWRSRALSLGVVGLAILGLAGLIVFNITQGEDKAGENKVTPRVWVLISQGVTAMLKSSTPLEYPDGHTDPWAVLRPVVGYGPETLYVAFNRFYPPELGWQLTVRGISPDRTHNETLDMLASTGWLGAAAYLALFAAAIYAVCQGLQMLSGSGRSTTFWSLALGGLTLGAGVSGAWQGPEAVGLGLAFGLAAGLSAFVLWCTGRAKTQPAPVPDPCGADTATEPGPAILLASLGAVILAHLVEINLGTAIVPTRTYFWLMLAVLCALGTRPNIFFTPSLSGETAEPQPDPPAGFRPTGKRWQPALISAGVTALLLMILGFDFVGNQSHSAQPIQIIVETLTARHSLYSGPFGILALVGITWLVGGTCGYFEEARLGTSRPSWKGAAFSLGAGLVIGGSFWLWLAGQHAALATTPITSAKILAAAASQTANLPTGLYLALGLLAGAWAVGLLEPWTESHPLRLRAIPAYLGGGVLVLGALITSVSLNLSAIQADIFFRSARSLNEMGQGQATAAISLYQQAIRRAPLEDHYDLFLGQAYLNLAKEQAETAAQETTLRQAETALRTAQTLNPLNTDHAANLARLYYQWTLLGPAPSDRQKLMEQSDANYAVALRLSPNNVALWNEWAKMSLQLREAPDAAQAALDHSLALDTTFGQTYQIQGELYLWRAEHANAEAGRKTYAEQAAQAYLAGLNCGDTAELHTGLAQAYEIEALYPQAIEQYQLAIQLTPTGSTDLWQLYQRLGRLYQKVNDLAQARFYGQKALDTAPAGSQADIEAWLKTLPD